jgi:cysteinyl-tRNA synthetase
MGLRLHNTLTRTKQDFVPIDAANVRMYVCGPTVYDFAHIGNARPLIVFDVLFRLLRHLYGDDHVTYVRNITDVDDKINARAAEEYPDMPLNDAIRAVTEKTTAQFHADVDALGCLRPTHEPRATEYVERPAAPTDMIRMIAELIANGHAYAAEGHVLFNVPSMPDYGKLSNRSLDDMIAGARVEVAPYKRDPMDFVLWKPSKPGEPAWPSPWSNGRPGWHIECSAMSGALLGDTFDIHGGGIDLIFPHHENEIAQSRCAHGTDVMANYWLHNGFLQVEGEKMSKSAGNFVTINELLATDSFGDRPWPGGLVRYRMLHTHYRQPIDWTLGALSNASLELNDLAIAVADSAELQAARELRKKGVGPTPSDEIVAVLSDDLNSPEALAVLHRHRRLARNSAEARNKLIADCEFLGIWTPSTIGLSSQAVAAVGVQQTNDLYSLGLRLRAAIANGNAPLLNQLREDLARSGRDFEMDQQGFLTFKTLGVDERSTFVEARIADRATARATKNFAEADRIRAELDAMGIALKDAKDPTTGELVTTWEVKR